MCACKENNAIEELIWRITETNDTPINTHVWVAHKHTKRYRPGERGRQDIIGVGIKEEIKRGAFLLICLSYSNSMLSAQMVIISNQV